MAGRRGTAFVLAIATTLLALQPSQGVASQSDPGASSARVDETRVVIHLNDDREMSGFAKSLLIDAIAEEAGLTLEGADDVPYITLKSVSGEPVTAAVLDMIRGRAEIESAEYLGLLELSAEEPLYPEQWYLNNRGSYYVGNGWLVNIVTLAFVALTRLPALLGMDTKWGAAASVPACSGQRCTGRDVLVGVLDSGFDISHPDLAGQVSTASRSFDTKASYSRDTVGHGTFVSSLIVGAENGIGMVGVAPEATVLGVKLDDVTGEGSFSTASILNGLVFVAESGADVINLSLAGPLSGAQEAAVYSWLDQEYPEILVIAAAGNDALEGNPGNYPASFPGVISVGSYDPYGLRSGFSNYNSFVLVSAPGTTILGARSKDRASCGGDRDLSANFVLSYENDVDCFFDSSAGSSAAGRYYVSNGTSYSAPIVAGAAALMKQKYGVRLETADFKYALAMTAEHPSLPQGQRDEEYGFGRLNMQRLLAFNFPVSLVQWAVIPQTPTVGQSLEIGVLLENLEGNADITTVIADLSPLGLGAETQLTAVDEDIYSTGDLIIPSGTAAGTYEVTVVVRDAGGWVDEGQLSVPVYAAGAAPPPTSIVSETVEVEITGPNGGDDWVTKKSAVTLKGSMSANVASLKINDEAVSISPGETSWQTRVELDDGANELNVQATDMTGTLTAEDSVEIEVDRDAPGPVKNLEADGMSLTWDAPRGGVEGYRVYRIEGSKESKVGLTRKREMTVKVPGTYAVIAEDEAGNKGDIRKAPQVTVGGGSAFVDVSASHFAANAIGTLNARGIVSGRGDRFYPESLVTRAEFAKMLGGAMGVTPNGGATFDDVPAGHSLAAFVGAVVSKGWASGQGRAFFPDRPVTRLEAAKMISRAKGLSASTTCAFSDLGGHADGGYACALYNAKIASGQGGQFLPWQYLTRAEAAKMLAALL